MRENLHPGLFVRAMPKHQADVVTLGEPPIGAVLPGDTETQHVTIVSGAAVKISHCENECVCAKHDPTPGRCGEFDFLGFSVLQAHTERSS